MAKAGRKPIPIKTAKFSHNDRDGIEITDEIKNRWEAKFQPVYGKYLTEESDLSFDKLTDVEFIELTKGSSLVVETLTMLYNYLVK